MPGMINHVRRRAYEAVNHRLRLWGGGKLAGYCRPTSIMFLLTELCNARCVHCYIWKNRGKEDSPSLEQWKRVLSDLRGWLGPAHIVFTGGEALLNPHAIELVRHGSSLGHDIEHLTHGYWADQSKIEQLALARPWRVTISFDGLGEYHDTVRGRENFFERTSATIQTLQRVRREQKLGFTMRLKTVIMAQNLENVCEVARFAATLEGADVFYQPIEQIYNTAEDPRWFETCENWPRDAARAVAVVEQIIALKRDGLPIGNEFRHLETMKDYFRDPAAWRVSIRTHQTHEARLSCSALGMIQLQANGDVTACAAMPPIGNIKQTPIRRIWESRPRWWEDGCCLVRRCSEVERTTKLHAIAS